MSKEKKDFESKDNKRNKNIEKPESVLDTAEDISQVAKDNPKTEEKKIKMMTSQITAKYFPKGTKRIIEK